MESGGVPAPAVTLCGRDVNTGPWKVESDLMTMMMIDHNDHPLWERCQYRALEGGIMMMTKIMIDHNGHPFWGGDANTGPLEGGG